LSIKSEIGLALDALETLEGLANLRDIFYVNNSPGSKIWGSF